MLRITFIALFTVAREGPALVPGLRAPVNRGAPLGTWVPPWPGSPTRPRWGGEERRRVPRTHVRAAACAMLGCDH